MTQVLNAGKVLLHGTCLYIHPIIQDNGSNDRFFILDKTLAHTTEGKLDKHQNTKQGANGESQSWCRAAGLADVMTCAWHVQ